MTHEKITNKFNNYWNKLGKDKSYVGLMANQNGTIVCISGSSAKAESVVAWGCNSKDEFFCFNSDTDAEEIKNGVSALAAVVKCSDDLEVQDKIIINLAKNNQAKIYYGGYASDKTEKEENDEYPPEEVKEFVAFCKIDTCTIVISYKKESGFEDNYIFSVCSELIKPAINNYYEMINKFIEGKENEA